MNYIEGSSPDKETDDDETQLKKKSKNLASKLLGKEAEKASKKPPEKIKWLEPQQPTPDKKTEADHEEDTELEELSAHEEIAIVAILRQDARNERSKQIPENELEETLNEVLDEFDTKIIEEHKSPEVALNEVLNELKIELEPEAETEIAKPGFLIEEEIWLRQTLSEDQPEAAIETKASLSMTDTKQAVPKRLQTEKSPSSLSIADGISSYLRSQRSNQLKNDKKAILVEQKLENRVNELNAELVNKEQTIRSAVTRLIEKERTKDKLSSEPQMPISRPERLKAPDAKTLHAPEEASERIGKLIVQEQSLETKPPIKQKSELSVTQKTEHRRVETMSHSDLIKTSEKITVNGTSLRHVYETHLIGEKGLRRLISEYYRGNDLKKALKKEIVEREIDFERDPVMRDMGINDNSSNEPSSAKLSQLIKNVEANMGTSKDELAFYKAKAKHDASVLETEKHRQYFIDSALISIIVLMAIIVTILIISRG